MLNQPALYNLNARIAKLIELSENRGIITGPLSEKNGEMAEWLKAHAWKACKQVTVSGVRIPLSPPHFAPRRLGSCVLQAIRMRKQMWYVYILESSKDKKHYIGSTNDLNRRLLEHNEGKVEATSVRRPLRLVSYIAVENEGQARSLEKYLKTGSGFSFIKKRILQSP